MSTDFLRELLAVLGPELHGAVALRERLHANPEPSHGEHETAALIAKALGTPNTSHIARTGLTARVGSAVEPAVVVRAELDALPVREATGAPFMATNGMMHACGHDVHMAALAAVFRAARGIEASLPRP
ncbi:MAG TPA: M20/M25/M40 family metallo-hydrolase, partial [Rubrobacteraceae bacterium]|nr:M20/M25/M40 family metallo-hydrolase [Rubrobacteraceae bacterium]